MRRTAARPPLAHPDRGNKWGHKLQHRKAAACIHAAFRPMFDPLRAGHSSQSRRVQAAQRPPIHLGKLSKNPITKAHEAD